MKKLLLSALLLALSSHTVKAADEVQLLADEMFLSESDATEIEAQTAEDNGDDKKSGGFFGFISRPLSKLFSSDDTKNTAALQETWLEKNVRLADEGNLNSQMDLAYMYLYGSDEVKQDFKKALQYYTMAAQQDDPIALNNLGSLYFSGIGTPRDIRTALTLFQKSAELGNDNAAINLAFIYLTGGKKDPERNKRAIELFESAKNKNNIAKFMLGYAYFKGFVVSQDYSKAFELIKTAAGGDALIDEAQLVLAEMYVKGLGTVQNYQNAISSYRAAVSQNNIEAIMMLAQIYVDGVICPKNPILAHALFNIAASKNIPDAADKRDEIAAKMKLEELAQAQDIAQNYKETPSELTGYIRQTYGSNIRQYIDNNI
ncbi:MAG: sel1 repeat family protein [Alphaproteobacteria bacterium]|nr:sel1 repeat family protein [Alphaproteobacteria bacterium]